MYFSVSSLACLAAIGFSTASSEQLDNYPIIGVFTQPSTSSNENCGGDCLYLAASYVKQMESAGARVVPVNYYAEKEELDHLFDSLSGFLFVGGGAVYPASAQYIFDKTVAANDNGDFMPVCDVYFVISRSFMFLISLSLFIFISPLSSHRFRF